MVTHHIEETPLRYLISGTGSFGWRGLDEFKKGAPSTDLLIPTPEP